MRRSGEVHHMLESTGANGHGELLQTELWEARGASLAGKSTTGREGYGCANDVSNLILAAGNLLT